MQINFVAVLSHKKMSVLFVKQRISGKVLKKVLIKQLNRVSIRVRVSIGLSAV